MNALLREDKVDQQCLSTDHGPESSSAGSTLVFSINRLTCRTLPSPMMQT